MTQGRNKTLWLALTFFAATVGVWSILAGPSPSTPAGAAEPALLSATASPRPLSALGKPDPYIALTPIAVGKPAPDFKVKTADESLIQLSQFKGKKNVVLIFYQGNFCTVCGHQLANLQKHYQDFKDQQAELIAISADDLAHAQMTLGAKGLSFYLVPDSDKTIIKKFGVANVSKNGIAWPSLFVVDKAGVVRFSYADANGKRLHSNEILPVLSKLTGKPAPKLSYEE